MYIEFNVFGLQMISCSCRFFLTSLFSNHQFCCNSCVSWCWHVKVRKHVLLKLNMVVCILLSNKSCINFNLCKIKLNNWSTHMYIYVIHMVQVYIKVPVSVCPCVQTRFLRIGLISIVFNVDFASTIWWHGRKNIYLKASVNDAEVTRIHY